MVQKNLELNYGQTMRSFRYRLQGSHKNNYAYLIEQEQLVENAI